MLQCKLNLMYFRYEVVILQVREDHDQQLG